MWWATLLLAGAICFVTFYAKGGLNPESSAVAITEIALTLGSAAIVVFAALFAPPERISRASRPLYGAWSLALLLALTALTALSVVWSVQPDESFREAGRMLAYSGVFAAAITLARVAPARWPAVLGGVTLAAVIVCCYALATKVFPAQLDVHDQYARLRAPFAYWNATGLMAALGVIGCMWLGARRAGHALLSALAYPAMGLLLVTLLLSYSRGALAALALGLALWFCVVPLRLRGAAVLVAGGMCAGGVVAWTFSTPALSSEAVALAARSSEGHRLGALLVAMVLVLALIGIALGFQTARQAPEPRARRRAGTVLLALLVLALLAFAGTLAASHRGLEGSVSHAVSALTNPNAKPPPNTPGRLTAVASVRARYWKEALEVFEAHPLVGAGAGGYQTARLRYRTALLEVKHAHGFVVQTLADLGAVGLALALALLLTWMAAAGRSTHPFNRRWTRWRAWRELRSSAGRPGWRGWPQPYPPERIATLSLLCLVVVFGLHSLIDWTWYVPGDACLALACAGWLAGRGPLRAGDAALTDGEAPVAQPAGAPLPGPETLGEGAPPGTEAADAPAGDGGARTRRWGVRSPRELGYARCAVALCTLAAGLLAAWTQWQPQSSASSSQQALALISSHPGEALQAAHTAVERDPLSAQALFALAEVERALGEDASARAALRAAVRLQPSNPETWLRLAEYDHAIEPREALHELQAAIFLNPESISPEAVADGDPESIEIENDYAEDSRALNPRATAGAVAPTAGSPARTR